VEAITTFLLLVLLQYILTYIEVRSKSFHKLVTSQPRLLYYNGAFLEKNLLKERIRQQGLLSAVRKKKFNSLNEVEAVILETDGTFSVIRKNDAEKNTSYQDLLEK
jgi:uncharacterized membrane protein YcaP (DUF421 family)